jgi:hypothetical protein
LYNIWNSPYCLTQHCTLQFTSTSLLIAQKFVRAFYHTSINNNPISSSAVNRMNKDVIWASWIPASMSFVIAFLCQTDFNARNFEQRFKQMTTGVWHRYALERERERERGGNVEFSVTDLIYYAIFCTCSSDSITWVLVTQKWLYYMRAPCSQKNSGELCYIMWNKQSKEENQRIIRYIPASHYRKGWRWTPRVWMPCTQLWKHEYNS